MSHCKYIGYSLVYSSFVEAKDENVKIFYNSSKALQLALQIEEGEKYEHDTQESMSLEARTTIL